jgi:hypothetical protein
MSVICKYVMSASCKHVMSLSCKYAGRLADVLVGLQRELQRAGRVNVPW